MIIMRPLFDLYSLRYDIEEKERTVLEQKVSKKASNGRYSVDRNSFDGLIENHKVLSDKAMLCAVEHFVPIGKEQVIPQSREKTVGSKCFHGKSPNCLAFRGVGGQDLSSIFHLLIIPKFKCVESPLQGEIGIRWCFDLNTQDIPMLLEMKSLGMAFVRKNRDYFIQMYKDKKELLLGKSIEYWLREENIQFGFHSKPSVGYLHMHMLIGPVTEFGYQEKYQTSWVPLEYILDRLLFVKGKTFHKEKYMINNNKKEKLIPKLTGRAVNQTRLSFGILRVKSSSTSSSSKM